MRKVSFWFLVFGFCFLTCVYVFDVAYLFHGIRCTYLRGENSAQIDDHRFFYNRLVPAKTPFDLPLAKKYTSNIENLELSRVLKKSKTISFLVVQNDSVCLEKYWGDGGRESLTNSFSMAKSIVSLLVGCAIEDGFIDGVDQSVFDFIPELRVGLEHDVEIKHLLEMSSGYDWLEHYKRPISVTAKAYYGSNLKNLILNRGFVEKPGVNHKYSSGSTQVLGLLLERAVGENVSSYASRVLWSRIGAKNDALWALDYNGGVEKVFCCFNSNARDFAKLGLLMLNRGSLSFLKNDSDSVVSVDYIDWLLSTPSLIDVAGGGGVVDYYSNGWWTASVLKKKVFYARGFLGQYVVVIPDLNLVFVRLGMWDDEASSLKNEYMLTDNLRFLIKNVIQDYSL